jgi:hypothetical protein
MQDLHQQRDAIQQRTGGRVAIRQAQIDQINEKIAKAEAENKRLSAKKNAAIKPSKALLENRDILQGFQDQRAKLQSDLAAEHSAAEANRQHALYGDPNAPEPHPDIAAAPLGGTKEAQAQLSKLTATRDALTAKLDQARGKPAELVQLQNNLTKVSAQIGRMRGMVPGKGERQGGIKEPFIGPLPVNRARTTDDYHFNDGTSVWRSIFKDVTDKKTGKPINPDTAASLPIERQNNIILQHMKDHFGFKDVRLEGWKEGSDNPSPVDRHIAQQAMLDMVRAMHDGMKALNLPPEQASLNGKLSLTLVPQGKRPYYGLYRLGRRSGEIEIMAGANSFGHEWIHARDHALSERLTGNPSVMNRLLTQYARGGELRPKDPIEGAFARLINTMFFDKPALVAARLGLENKAQEIDAKGNPTKAARDAQRELELLDKGGTKLPIQLSKYREQSASYDPRPKGVRYFASAHEMMARAGEAHMSEKMEQAGQDPRGIVMPNAAYLEENVKILKMIYPKEDDRAAIFKALDDLNEAIANEQIFSNGKPPGDWTDYGKSDKHHWPVTAPNAMKTPVGRGIARAIDFQSRVLKELDPRDQTRPKNPQSLVTRIQDKVFRAHMGSAHGYMKAIIERAPEKARAYLQSILDSLASAPGEGRYTVENFEERVRNVGREFTRRMGNIMQASGLVPGKMSIEESQMLHHVLTVGTADFPIDPNNPAAGTKPIPGNILAAAGNMRDLLNEAWAMSRKAGLDIGFAKSGYFPRVYDLAKIMADGNGFHASAKELHQLMFDQELGPAGSNPEALFEKWSNGVKAEDKRLTGGAPLRAPFAALGRNLERQREIEAAGGPQTPVEQAELKQLQREATNLATTLHPKLSEHLAELNADDWRNRMTSGEPTSFDKSGPSGRFLNARVLPPEADRIMRDWMWTDPAVALPHYFDGVARRVAQANLFGADGKLLEQQLRMAKAEGVSDADANTFREMANNVMGRNQERGSSQLQSLHQIAHALGSIALMPRAMWASWAEPMNAALATGDMRTGFKSFAYQMQALTSRASARERTELAQFLNVITTPMHDSVMLSRMGADYSDSPNIQRFMTKYYRVSGLTWLTNAQRVASMAANHWFLTKLARDYTSTEISTHAKHAREDAARWFNELGVAGGGHPEFADWLLQHDTAPNARAIENDPMRSTYGLAIRRLVDRSIQDPYKVDRAIGASRPIIGLMFQLMSFNYQFNRNVLMPTMERIKHDFGRSQQEALDAGSGRINALRRGAFGAAGTTVHTGLAVGAIVGANVMASTVRQLLFAPDQVKQHAEDGDLASYLLNLGIGRSGLNGPLDPLVQVATHLRYNADIASLINGPSLTWALSNMNAIVQGFIGPETDTNTRLYNAWRGAFNLIGVPLAAYGLTALGTVGGPVTRVIAGAALQLGTSPHAANAAATYLAGGPKGTKAAPPDTGEGGLKSLDDERKAAGFKSLDEMAKENADTGGGGRDGSGPGVGPGGAGFGWGIADDIAVPAARYGAAPIARYASSAPWPVKALGVAAGLGYAAHKAAQARAPFVDQPAPEHPQHH